MKKRIFNVTFHYAENTWCSNVVIAEDENIVFCHYRKYDGVYVEEGKEYDVEDARRRGKPVIEL